MNLSDDKLVVYAIREPQLILAGHIEPRAWDAAKTINELLAVLDRDGVVEAVDRLGGTSGRG